MRRRSNHAPRSGTIVLAAVLTVFAALVFFTSVLPATIAGFATGTLALYAAIVAFVLLLLGTFIEGV
jgi:dolichol kinase